MEDNQKRIPAKRIQLVDVVLERKGSVFEGRHSSENVPNVIPDFVEDSNREKFTVLCLSNENGPSAMQVVHTGSFA